MTQPRSDFRPCPACLHSPHGPGLLPYPIYRADGRRDFGEAVGPCDRCGGSARIGCCYGVGPPPGFCDRPIDPRCKVFCPHHLEQSEKHNAGDRRDVYLGTDDHRGEVEDCATCRAQVDPASCR